MEVNVTNHTTKNPTNGFNQTNPILQVVKKHQFKPVRSKNQVNLKSGIYPSTWNTGNCWVDISSIYIEETCQRPITSQRKDKIVKNVAARFDPKKFKRPILVEDPNKPGKYICVDGQGRIIAAHMNGNIEVPCEIHKPNGDFEDYCRDIFVSQHDNEDKVKGWEQHNVAITMDEDYISTSEKGTKRIYNTAKDMQKVLDYDKQNYTFATSDFTNLLKSNKKLIVKNAYIYIKRTFGRAYQLESNNKSEPTNGNRNPMFPAEILKAFADEFGDPNLIGQNFEAAAGFVLRRYVREMKLRDPANLPSWQGGSSDNKNCKINSNVLIEQVDKLRSILLHLMTREKNKITSQESLKEILETKNKANGGVLVGADRFEEIYKTISSNMNLAS